MTCLLLMWSAPSLTLHLPTSPVHPCTWRRVRDGRAARLRVSVGAVFGSLAFRLPLRPLRHVGAARAVAVSRQQRVGVAQAAKQEQTEPAAIAAKSAEHRWCSVVINLARRPDRRLQLAHVLANGDAEVLARLLRVDAVDGRNLDLEDAAVESQVLDYITPDALRVAQEAKQIGAHTIVHKDGELVKFHDHLTEGGIACAMSHYKALKTVADHPTAEWALILEDDIEALVPDVHLQLENIISRLPETWDALFVGYHGGVLQGTGPGGTDTQQEQTRAEFELQIDEMRGVDNPGWDSFQGSVEAYENEIPVLRMYSPLYGLYAWVVRKDAAKRLLEEAFPVPGQVDHALSLWLVQQGNSFKVAPRHMLFYSPKSEVGLDSDIQTMTHLDQLLADPQHCEEYMNFINSHQSAENPREPPA